MSDPRKHGEHGPPTARTVESPVIRPFLPYDCGAITEVVLAGIFLLEDARRKLHELVSGDGDLLFTDDEERYSAAINKLLKGLREKNVSGPAAQEALALCDTFVERAARARSIIWRFCEQVDRFSSTCLNRDVSDEELDEYNVGSQPPEMEEVEPILEELSNCGDAFTKIWRRRFGKRVSDVLALGSPDFYNVEMLFGRLMEAFAAAQMLFRSARNWIRAMVHVAHFRSPEDEDA
jgi:hypothetical protein